MTSGGRCFVWRCLSSRLSGVMAVVIALGAWVAGVQDSAGQDGAKPTRLLVCESSDQSCLKADPKYAAEWSFDGTTGVVTSPASESGTQLTIDTMSQDKIVIRRVDASGRSATYSGTIHGSHVTGTVEWTSGDQTSGGQASAPATGSWSAMFRDLPAAVESSPGASTPSASGLPVRLIECEGGGPCNGAWSFDGLSGTATWFTQSPIRAKLTIVRSDPDEITIRRTDLTDGNSAVYQGTRKGDTYSGAVIWSSPNNPGGGSGHWTASIPQTECDPSSNLSSADAMRIGQNALMFDLKREAFDCAKAAAEGGDAMAQTIVGLTYYQGRAREVPQNYANALYWLKKAAAQGVYAAQQTLSDMYTLGEGTEKNPELARFYGDKAATQKQDAIHEKERREDRADRAADREAYILGQAFGSFLFVF
jgi:hypothetical protein